MADGSLSPSALRDRLDEVGYVADDDLAAAAFLAIELERPLLLEGAPGVGKTYLAVKLADALGAQLIRLQCYAGLDASQALYDWNFARQMLYLRATEGERRLPQAQVDPVYSHQFLIPRPILQALRQPRSLLLIDEVDRADDEFEALLLEFLDTYEVTIPELGTLRASRPPLVVLTSNGTREVHDAIRRRCFYHRIQHPDPERELEILRRAVRDLPEQLGRDVTAVMRRLREGRMQKPPGIGEALDLTRAALALGQSRLTELVALQATGTVAKTADDYEPTRAELRREARAA
jgi:MoxR-like ATPase